MKTSIKLSIGTYYAIYLSPSLYLSLYRCNSTPIYLSSLRQEIVANLVEHIGSPVLREVDAALDAISHISMQEDNRLSTSARPRDKDRDRVTMKNFLPFLKYILGNLYHYLSIYLLCIYLL
jgi:hypothetical protein